MGLATSELIASSSVFPSNVIGVPVFLASLVIASTNFFIHSSFRANLYAVYQSILVLPPS
jgi:hypothetical protein